MSHAHATPASHGTSVLYEVAGGVATVTLNRPHALNALSHHSEAAMMAAIDRADQDRSVRVIVLTGAGKAFCVGYDMEHADDADAEHPHGETTNTAEQIGWWQRRLGTEVDNLVRIMQLGKPVIAAVNGYCMGGGFFYQLACDITIASDRAIFALPEVRQVAGTTFLFTALAGWKAANRYSLTGDHFDAQEALRLGVINEVVPHERLVDATSAFARRLCLVPEASVRLNKAIAMRGALAGGVAAGLDLNKVLSTLVHTSVGPDTERLQAAFHEGGMKAFLAERDDPFRPEPFGPRATGPS